MVSELPPYPNIVQLIKPLPTNYNGQAHHAMDSRAPYRWGTPLYTKNSGPCYRQKRKLLELHGSDFRHCDQTAHPETKIRSSHEGRWTLKLMSVMACLPVRNRGGIRGGCMAKRGMLHLHLSSQHIIESLSLSLITFKLLTFLPFVYTISAPLYISTPVFDAAQHSSLVPARALLLMAWALSFRNDYKIWSL